MDGRSDEEYDPNPDDLGFALLIRSGKISERNAQLTVSPIANVTPAQAQLLASWLGRATGDENTVVAWILGDGTKESSPCLAFGPDAVH